ncbi:1942_t:CDS:2 [Ambispora gerdemannii]|uniref:1942_t:CDS:1 n=1 Tax=Ambispora gerdemannii TaxID=144530 RepID=A0A9N9D7Z2_9GLOM|nr:1942_t:CDS:2 [Ambispora gerdemannii]
MDTQAKSDKVLLTPEYLDWYSKLTDLPTTISDKLRSKLQEKNWTQSLDKLRILSNQKGYCIIHEAVHKRFPFLSYTNSNAWHRDVFKYTDSETKCPVCKEKVIVAIQSLPETQVRVSNKISNSLIHPNKTHLYQYAIKHGMDPEEFSVITEAEKNRNEDTRKYHKFLTDQDRLIGEELLRHSILKSGLSTTWLNDLMKE